MAASIFRCFGTEGDPHEMPIQEESQSIARRRMPSDGSRLHGLSEGILSVLWSNCVQCDKRFMGNGMQKGGEGMRLTQREKADRYDSLHTAIGYQLDSLKGMRNASAEASNGDPSNIGAFHLGQKNAFDFMIEILERWKN